MPIFRWHNHNAKLKENTKGRRLSQYLHISFSAANITSFQTQYRHSYQPLPSRHSLHLRRLLSEYELPSTVARSSALTALTIRIVKVDISHLLRTSDSNQSSPARAEQARNNEAATPTAATAGAPPHAATQTTGSGGKRSMPPQPTDPPAKKQSKWSVDEDALIIELRGSGMKWEDISQRLPGRSAISCRLHYQNYLERRCDWSDEKKSKLARLYERFKPEMWQKVAEEMGVPWRAAEAMHWQLGEVEMARRAGVVPFSLSAANNLDTSSSHPSYVRPTSHGSSHRGHTHSTSTSTLGTGPSPKYHREGLSTRSVASRRDTMTRPPLASPSDSYTYDRDAASMNVTMSGPPPMLPGVAEMTTGVSPYSTPAYSLAGRYDVGSPGPYLPPMNYPSRRTGEYEMIGRNFGNEGKRTRSPEKEGRDTNKRRQER